MIKCVLIQGDQGIILQYIVIQDLLILKQKQDSMAHCDLIGLQSLEDLLEQRLQGQVQRIAFLHWNGA